MSSQTWLWNEWSLLKWNAISGVQTQEFDSRKAKKIIVSLNKPETHSQSFVTIHVDITPREETKIPNSLDFEFEIAIGSTTLKEPRIPKKIPPDFSQHFSYDFEFSRFRWDTPVPDDNDGILTIKIRIFECTNPICRQNSRNIQRPLFKGIKRPSNTCYMNVIVQMLYHLPAFQRLIFNVDTREMISEDRRLIVALQTTFLELLKESKGNCISIDNLLSAFDMDQISDIKQEDTHQFLIDILNELREKVGLKKEITDLFGFKQQSGKSHEIQDEICWTLNLDNNKTFQESIQADRHEYQLENGEMAKDVFITLPKVLIMHLNLFNDPNRPDIKITPKIAFDQTIDLGPFVEGDEYVNKGKYSLYAVIIHYGNLSSGHFYIILRPRLGTQFYVFNDENVQKPPVGFLDYKNTKSLPAYPYLLVYVRDDVKDEVGYDKSFKIPDYIRNGDLIEETKLNFHVRTKVSLANNINNGFIGFSPTNAIHTFKIEANSKDTNEDLYELVKKERHLSNGFRLWVRNKESLIGSLLEKTKDHRLAELNDYTLFLDELDAIEPMTLNPNQIRLFLVFFDPTNTQFEFITARTVNETETVQSLIPSTILLLRHSHHNFPQDQLFDVYRDCITSKLEKLDISSSFSSLSSKHGSILIFVPQNSKPKIENPPPPQPYFLSNFYPEEKEITLDKYYEQHYCSWDFRVLTFGEDQKNIVINIPYTKPFSKLVNFLVECLGLNFRENIDEMLVFPVEYEGDPKIRPLINPSKTGQIHSLLSSYTAFYIHIAYEKAGQLFFNPKTDPPDKKKYAVVRVSLSNDSIHVNYLYQTVVSIPFTPKDVAESLGLSLPSPLRCRNVSSSAKSEILDFNQEITELYYHIRFELDKQYENEITILTGTMNKKNNLSFYGQPFTLPVYEDETFDALIDRYCDKMECKATDFDFVCINTDSIIDTKYERGADVSIFKAAKEKYRFVALKQPNKYETRENDFVSRY